MSQKLASAVAANQGATKRGQVAAVSKAVTVQYALLFLLFLLLLLLLLIPSSAAELL